MKSDQKGREIPVGSRHYRAFVGPTENYDLVSAMQFNLLTALQLREHHFLLDIGCGSLRGGRLFIPYLMPGHYFGVEPEGWLIEEGVNNEIGEDILRIRRPVFSHDGNFTLTLFNQKFDYILAQSIFSHTSRRQIKRCLSEARKVMKPASIFAATFVLGEKDYEGEDWVYPGCVTYTWEGMKGFVEEQGLICKPLNWPHPNLQTWMVILTRENEKNVFDFDDVVKMSNLRDELSFCKERLSRFEGSLYVKLGLKIFRLIQRMKWHRR